MKRNVRYLFIEWVFWCALVAFLWVQTGKFTEEIGTYRFGADGWPKAVLLGLLIGATGQLALGVSGLSADGKTDTAKPPAREINRLQQAAIFIVPLIYLWVMHRIGFFVATPLFVLLYLRILEVRKWQHLIGVTAIIYIIVLAIFVRLFYVALPVGAWEMFYEINNRIITLVRIGVQ